jgi:hypothetical protein
VLAGILDAEKAASAYPRSFDEAQKHLVLLSRPRGLPAFGPKGNEAVDEYEGDEYEDLDDLIDEELEGEFGPGRISPEALPVLEEVIRRFGTVPEMEEIIRKEPKLAAQLIQAMAQGGDVPPEVKAMAELFGSVLSEEEQRPFAFRRRKKRRGGR